jgi:hypothetical protein
MQVITDIQSRMGCEKQGAHSAALVQGGIVQEGTVQEGTVQEGIVQEGIVEQVTYSIIDSKQSQQYHTK